MGFVRRTLHGAHQTAPVPLDPAVRARAEGRIVELREEIEEARDRVAKIRPACIQGLPAAVLGDIEQQLTEAKRQTVVLSEALAE